MARHSSGGIRYVATIVAEAYCPACEKSYPEALERCPDDGTRLVRLAQKPDELIGRTVDDRFHLVEKLGIGGMGSVYRAERARGDEDIAIKVINPDLSNNLDAAKRFLREAKLASRIDHENSVRVLDYGQTGDGLLYLAMELVEGRTLDDILGVSITVEEPRVARLALQILDALDHAHSLGIVHRDLKPSNIIVVNGAVETVKVVDFGLAKSLGGDFTTTEAGNIMGTPAYLAPELVFGGEVTGRVDLYSTGILLYELLTGQLPFDDDDVSAVLMAHAFRPAPPLTGVTESLASFVLKLIEKKPEQRFQTAESARSALESIRRELGWDDSPKWLHAETDVESEFGEDEDTGTLREYSSFVEHGDKPTPLRDPPPRPPTASATEQTLDEETHPRSHLNTKRLAIIPADDQVINQINKMVEPTQLVGDDESLWKNWPVMVLAALIAVGLGVALAFGGLSP